MILLLIKDLGFSCKSKRSLIQGKREFLDFYARLDDSLAEVKTGVPAFRFLPGYGLLIAGTDRNLTILKFPERKQI